MMIFMVLSYLPHDLKMGINLFFFFFISRLPEAIFVDGRYQRWLWMFYLSNDGYVHVYIYAGIYLTVTIICTTWHHYHGSSFVVSDWGICWIGVKYEEIIIKWWKSWFYFSRETHWKFLDAHKNKNTREVIRIPKRTTRDCSRSC